VPIYIILDEYYQEGQNPPRFVAPIEEEEEEDDDDDDDDDDNDEY
jgi:hypothetical protein